MTFYSCWRKALQSNYERYHVYDTRLTQHAIFSFVLSVIAGMRMKYKDKTDLFMEESLVSKEPIGQLQAWFEEALNCKEVKQPNAMCLTTVSNEGFPSARFMICREFDKDGFKFFTNYQSRKGIEMESNPHVAAVFYWPGIYKQVSIQGKVEKIDPALSDRFWKLRPLPSKISVHTGQQSKPVSSRAEMHMREASFEAKHKVSGKEIPRPDYWGGYIIRPKNIEFWQGHTNHLHDRIRFRKPNEGEHPDGKLLHKGDDGWVYERLCP